MASPAKESSSAESEKTRSEPKMGESLIVKAYLIAYNVAQMVGWTFLMVKMVQHLIREKKATKLYGEVEPVLQIFQTAAVLEIVHSAVGVVKSNPVLTGFQVFSRVFLLWGVVWSVPQVQTSDFIVYFLMAWTITEIIRYSFYFFSLLGAVPYVLKWCRYTFFIVLYPIGVMGEVMTIYQALPHVKASGMYSLSLPNVYNISFSYYLYLWVVIVSYLPVFPQLYGHMLKQRKKIISNPPRPKQQ
ncbi:very-long-chain (3R)-3-hydroxyacyl-CoA dehydratase 2-like [Babylonia areolata]|uniref:very-long-chain (3R)-3-hydroxyacyl-CoA dehydratase 2-like n=1 Tax=Babylonia areolata TaxID=304850 RepID=UPI003FD0E4B1